MRTSPNAFIFVILLIISTYIFKKLLQMFPKSTILNYVVSVATELKLSWDNLLMQSFNQTPYYKFNVVAGKLPEIGVRVFEGEPEAVECAVCLCKIEKGEEVGDLKCNHIFHRDCLDRWLGTGRKTCPLCRTHVNPGTRFLEDVHQEVVVFDFFSNHRDRCTWWLR